MRRARRDAAFLFFGVSALMFSSTMHGQGDSTVRSGRGSYLVHCAVCHGQDARGGAGMPDLVSSPKVTRGDEKRLFEIIRDGIEATEMPPLVAPAHEIWELVAYLRGLETSSGEPVSEANLWEGQRIFRREGCAHCHRIAGQGAHLGRDLSDIGMRRTREEIEKILQDPGLHFSEHYRPVVLTTTENETVRGVVMNRDNFSLQLLAQEGRLRFFWRSELREIKSDPAFSVKDYTESLNREALNRLLEFLESQRSTALRVSPGTSAILPR